MWIDPLDALEPTAQASSSWHKQSQGLLEVEGVSIQHDVWDSRDGGACHGLVVSAMRARGAIQTCVEVPVVARESLRAEVSGREATGDALARALSECPYREVRVLCRMQDGWLEAVDVHVGGKTELDRRRDAEVREAWGRGGDGPPTHAIRPCPAHGGCQIRCPPHGASCGSRRACGRLRTLHAARRWWRPAPTAPERGGRRRPCRPLSGRRG